METNLERSQEAFAQAYSDFIQQVKRLTPNQRTTSGVCGDWSPKQVADHLIGWDTALLGLILEPEGFDPTPLYQVNDFNAKSVVSRQHQSWEISINELQENYTNLQSALSTVSESNPIYQHVLPWLGGRIEDYQHHTGQLEAWMKAQ